jgi:hypothetical protein
MQKRLSKILFCIEVLIEQIDEPNLQPTKESKLIQDKSRELQKMIIPVLDRFYKGDVSNSNFFNVMHKKFNYNFEREYKK